MENKHQLTAYQAKAIVGAHLKTLYAQVTDGRRIVGPYALENGAVKRIGWLDQDGFTVAERNVINRTKRDARRLPA